MVNKTKTKKRIKTRENKTVEGLKKTWKIVYWLDFIYRHLKDFSEGGVF